ncbi:RagB/SusD family nutrient uptake outer membrane protein [Aquimarina brevivitae]|uniref:SusD-like starch-binding protein associating with outer membrane n=1 Tax=Aquimarina brevivitae TaxID=323412 RepID=A0A4Q7NZR1_9FLAO|nr:RagB/SusD family nutrient uptake outer membrane protein [Aquimarina brevivitae]RZS92550.1 SusD-like starch-binding protein associating with outer membrane [Aquimarina brevivitae]
MKNYKYFLHIFFFIGLLSFVGCENDLNVELEDDDDLLASDLFDGPDAYKRAIAGVYANLSLTSLDGATNSNITGLDPGTGQYMRGLFNLQNLATDEAIWTFENDPGLRGIQRNSWDANNVLILGVFARATFQVALANEFLRQTTGAKLDERGVSAELREEITTYRAEARVLRALAYYHLMDMFGRAPFLTENDPVGFVEGPEYLRPELFEFIETELLEVQEDLLDVNAGAANEYARVDKGVAKMILAKIYLNAEVYLGEGNDRYADCLTTCQEIINSGYSLVDNYSYNFLADNDSNGAQNEIIFPIVHDGTTTQNFGGTTILIQGQVNGNTEALPTGESLGVQSGGFGGLFRLRKEFAELFTSNPLFDNDNRNTVVTQDVVLNEDGTVDSATDRPIEIDDITDNSTGYLIAKYSNLTSNGMAGSDPVFTDTDFPMFRLADVYLMYAEAHLQGGGGDITTATNYVNLLRERAFGDTSANITETDLTMDFLIDERARELHWESHRRQDLIRFGLYSGGQYLWAYKGGPQNGSSISENLEVYPVPEQSRATNRNLGQNTGY